MLSSAILRVERWLNKLGSVDNWSSDVPRLVRGIQLELNKGKKPFFCAKFPDTANKSRHVGRLKTNCQQTLAFSVNSWVIIHWLNSNLLRILQLLSRLMIWFWSISHPFNISDFKTFKCILSISPGKHQATLGCWSKFCASVNGITAFPKN